MNVDDVIAERIAAARAKAQAAKTRRARHAAARKAGLRARYATKVRYLNQTDLTNNSLTASGA